MDIFDRGLVGAMAGIAALIAACALWPFARKRNRRPRRMATRRDVLPKPSKESTRYMTPGSL